MENKVVWLTGLSGSGKTTLANNLKKKLLNKKKKVLLIDGDKFRKKNKTKNSFSKKNIYKNNISIIQNIYRIKKKYDFIIVSVISPLKKTRLIAKKTFGKSYFEVFVNCSIKELFKRDTKKLYIKAKKNIIKNLIGYNSKIIYEKTKYKKIKVNTHLETINQSTIKILKNIDLNQYNFKFYITKKKVISNFLNSYKKIK